MKTNFSTQQLDQIKLLFDQHFGSRKIAKIMNVNRSTIIRAYRQLGLDSFSVKTIKYVYLATEKKCKDCNIKKSIDNFRKRQKKDRISYESYCKDCEKIRRNKLSLKRYHILKKTSANFLIRRSLSYSIWYILKSYKSSKNGKSCLSNLDYSIDDLRSHLESQFESWMNWENYGSYKIKDWRDNDQSTWKWQLDHIIPQSDLPYTSMEDENFKKCWDLNNLRPLNYKQNLEEGTRRLRHKKI